MNKRKLVESFIKENISSAYRFAFTYMKNQHDAEDVVSESIIKALKGADGIKDISKLKSWYFRIIRNTAIDSIKKNMDTLPIEVMDCRETYEDDYNISGFADLIERLPKEYLEVITLRYFEDMKIKDISETLGVNESTIKTRLYKALKILKEEVDDDYE